MGFSDLLGDEVAEVAFMVETYAFGMVGAGLCTVTESEGLCDD